MSPEVSRYVLFFILAVLSVIALRVFFSPAGFWVKILVNDFLGFVGLFIFNVYGPSFGAGLGLNFFNAAVIGVLGVPGLILLLIVKWLFST